MECGGHYGALNNDWVECHQNPQIDSATIASVVCRINPRPEGGKMFLVGFCPVTKKKTKQKKKTTTKKKKENKPKKKTNGFAKKNFYTKQKLKIKIKNKNWGCKF